MRISHRYKFVFISKPRCASTTIRTLLDPYSDIISESIPPYHHHATAQELKLHFDTMGWNWNDYFVFSTVRNPWEMMVSYYHFFKPDVNGIYNFEQERDGIAYNANNLINFNLWLESGKTHHRIFFKDGVLYKNIWVKGFSKLTLANTINDFHGVSLVNKVVKVEELNTKIYEIFENIGIEFPPEIIKINCSESFSYHDYYSKESKEIIEKEFESDIIYGNYTF